MQTPKRSIFPTILSLESKFLQRLLRPSLLPKFFCPPIFLPNFSAASRGNLPRSDYLTIMSSIQVEVHLNNPITKQLDWGSIFESHRRWLSTIVRARLADPHAAADVLQEVALVAISQANRPVDSDKIAPWLYRITLRKIVNHHRASGRARRVLESVANKPDSQEPGAWLVQKEIQTSIQEGLSKLHPQPWAWPQTSQTLSSQNEDTTGQRPAAAPAYGLGSWRAVRCLRSGFAAATYGAITRRMLFALPTRRSLQIHNLLPIQAIQIHAILSRMHRHGEFWSRAPAPRLSKSPWSTPATSILNGSSQTTPWRLPSSIKSLGVKAMSSMSNPPCIRDPSKTVAGLWFQSTMCL